jgi:hypothetical protein
MEKNDHCHKNVVLETILHLEFGKRQLWIRIQIT